MTRARGEVLSESLIRRLEAQFRPLGVDVHAHVANVTEWCHRAPEEVENPPGVLVDWCQRDADALAAKRAERERDVDRYAVLMVELLAWVVTERPTPREVARVLRQSKLDGYPGLNPRTIVRLRSMRDWAAPVIPNTPAQTNRAAATMAGVLEDTTGRLHAGSHA